MQSVSILFYLSRAFLQSGGKLIFGPKAYLSRPVKVTRVFSASNSRLGAVQAQSTHCIRVKRKISNGLCAKFCRLSVIQFKCTHLSSTCITATNLLSYKNIAQGNFKKSPHAQLCLSKGLIHELIEVDLSQSLRFVNPQKQSEYTIRNWRIKHVFKCSSASFKTERRLINCTVQMRRIFLWATLNQGMAIKGSNVCCAVMNTSMQSIPFIQARKSLCGAFYLENGHTGYNQVVNLVLYPQSTQKLFRAILRNFPSSRKQ